ncbi:MAG: agmatinase, partial [Anaerolineales bacterium]|nr:agmatinase [Anaerolineales bacterium]
DGKRVGVIHFDAHHDMRSGWGQNAGLWVREIQETTGTPVRGENIVQIGIHGFSYSVYYRDIVQEMGITVFKPADVRRLGIDAVMAEALDRVADGTDAIFVSVDIDVVEPPYVPGTNSAAHGGMQPWDVVRAVVLAGQHPLTRALDLMEIAPPYDANRITSTLGAEISMHFLGALSLRKGAISAGNQEEAER